MAFLEKEFCSKFRIRDMTVGIAILLLWVARVIIKLIRAVESKTSSPGCGTVILGLVYVSITIWMIIRFWNIPWQK